MTNSRDLANLGGGFIQAGGGVQRAVESKLSDVVSVKDFGAVGDGINDDAAAITAAAAAHNGLYFPSGTYKLGSTVNLRSRMILAEEAKFVGDHADIVLLLGGNAAGTDNPYQNVRAVSRVGGDYSTTPAVRILGAKNQQIWIKRCPYIQLYADSDLGTIDSCAYSSFWFNYVETLEFDTNPAPSGSTTQWINENVFYLNRINTLRLKGTYNHNHNRFLYGSFENGTIDFQVGSHNRVERVRGEGGCDVTFAAGTNSNVALATWQSSGRDYSWPGTVTDLGIGNHAGHQRLIDNPLRTLVGFTYAGLQYRGDGNYNVPNISNITINASSFSVGSFDYFYDSGLIPCTQANMLVVTQLLGRISGGFRINITGFDASKVAIASTGSDYYVSGIGSVGFGNSAPTTSDGAKNSSVAWITNASTVFIRIRALASANALEAEGFSLAVSPTNSDLDSFTVEAYANTNTASKECSLTKRLTLSDNVQDTLFTFAIPEVTGNSSNVSYGFELSYVVRCNRTSSTRNWQAYYGKVYGVITRGRESAANAAPVFTIDTTSSPIVSASSGGSAATITWAESVDAGADDAAKNGYLAITVDNPFSSTNVTNVEAKITWINSGNLDVTVS